MLNIGYDGTVPTNDFARPISISHDGRYVLFSSRAPLVSNDTNSEPDLFVRDLLTGSNSLVNVTTNGSAGETGYGADMSADGRWVAFTGFGSEFSEGVPEWGFHIYLRDMAVGTNRWISMNTSPSCLNPTVSANGRFIAFEARLGSGAAVFLHDAQTGATTRVTENCSGEGYIFAARISGDGHFVFFQSADMDYTDGEFFFNDVNIYRWERATAETTLVSLNKTRTGGARDWETFDAVSYDGDVVAFSSTSSDLSFGDKNNGFDIFVWQAGILPRLNISLSEGMITITWPTDSPDAVLETRTNDSDWVPVSGSIGQEAGTYIYETPVDAASPRFFQLRLL